MNRTGSGVAQVHEAVDLDIHSRIQVTHLPVQGLGQCEAAGQGLLLYYMG